MNTSIEQCSFLHRTGAKSRPPRRISHNAYRTHKLSICNSRSVPVREYLSRTMMDTRKLVDSPRSLMGGISKAVL